MSGHLGSTARHGRAGLDTAGHRARSSCQDCPNKAPSIPGQLRASWKALSGERWAWGFSAAGAPGEGAERTERAGGERAARWPSPRPRGALGRGTRLPRKVRREARCQGAAPSALPAPGPDGNNLWELRLLTFFTLLGISARHL